MKSKKEIFRLIFKHSCDALLALFIAIAGYLQLQYWVYGSAYFLSNINYEVLEDLGFEYIEYLPSKEVND